MALEKLPLFRKILESFRFVPSDVSLGGLEQIMSSIRVKASSNLFDLCLFSCNLNAHELCKIMYYIQIFTCTKNLQYILCA